MEYDFSPASTSMDEAANRGSSRQASSTILSRSRAGAIPVLSFCGGMKDGMKRTLSRENRPKDLPGRPDMAAMDGIERPAEKAYPFLHPRSFSAFASASRTARAMPATSSFNPFPVRAEIE